MCIIVSTQEMAATTTSDEHFEEVAIHVPIVERLIARASHAVEALQPLTHWSPVRHGHVQCDVKSIPETRWRM